MATKTFCDICGAPAREDVEVKVRYQFGGIRKDEEYNEYRSHVAATVSFSSHNSARCADLCARCTLLILDELKKKVEGKA